MPRHPSPAVRPRRRLSAPPSRLSREAAVAALILAALADPRERTSAFGTGGQHFVEIRLPFDLSTGGRTVRLILVRPPIRLLCGRSNRRRGSPMRRPIVVIRSGAVPRRLLQRPSEKEVRLSGDAAALLHCYGRDPIPGVLTNLHVLPGHGADCSTGVGHFGARTGAQKICGTAQRLLGQLASLSPSPSLPGPSARARARMAGARPDLTEGGALRARMPRRRAMPCHAVIGRIGRGGCPGGVNRGAEVGTLVTRARLRLALRAE
jgi:hypothetical protein